MHDLVIPTAFAALLLLVTSPVEAKRRAAAMSDDGADLPTTPSYRAWRKAVAAVIRARWLEAIPPEAKAGEKGAVMVRFCVLSDGSIAGPEVLLREGPASFDAAALKALAAASPLPPAPAGKVEGGLRIRYTFFYNLSTSLTQHWSARAKWRTRSLPDQACPDTDVPPHSTS